MTLTLSEQQRGIVQSTESLARKHLGQARRYRDGDGRLDRAVWREIASAGWLLAGDPADGKLGAFDLALVAEQSGRALLPLPLAQGMAAAAALDWLGQEDAAAEGAEVLLAAMTVPAPADTLGRNADGSLSVRRLEFAVPFGADADRLLLPITQAGAAYICRLSASDVGAAIATTRQVDGSHIATVRLQDVRISSENVFAVPAEVCDRVTALLLLATGAEMLGVSEETLAKAIEYIKLREQYGRPLGSFQALQHRVVEEYVKVEVLRACVFQTCALADRSGLSLFPAAAVKAKASEAGMEVARAAIQLHGGIGFTDAHDAGLYLKRAMVLSARFGNAARSRSLYARTRSVDGISPQAGGG